MSELLHCYLHLLFVAASVFSIRERLTLFYLGEVLFWGLATTSVLQCVNIIFASGTSGKSSSAPAGEAVIPLKERPARFSRQNSPEEKLREILSPDRSEEKLKGIQILQARYGKGNTEVDVTEKVRAMIKDDILTIDTKMDFNAQFGDPCFGWPKKLRIMGFKNGEPFQKSLRERPRLSDVIINGNEEGPVGTSFTQENEEIEESIQSIESWIGTSGSLVARPEGSGGAKPIIRSIQDRFQDLQPSLPFENVKWEAFALACETFAEKAGGYRPTATPGPMA
jgi:hypothetical protein